MKKLNALLLLTALFITACGQAPTPPVEVTEDTEQVPPTEYTMAEVEKHNTKETCWSVIDGKIYDLTDWMSKHPGGGEDNVLKICGMDGTEAFTGIAQEEEQLDKYYIGMLIQ